MLRKSPYIQENYDSFYTKEWDRSNSLLNSQESITQALNFMQNLRLDHYENSPAKGSSSGKDMIGESMRGYNQSQQMKQSQISNGAMIDISSQVNKANRIVENNHNHLNQYNKRSTNYSAFDQTSSMLLQANQDIFVPKKPVVDNNTQMMKELFQNNNNHTVFNPQYCTYCKQHYDQVLLQKRQKEAAQSKENACLTNKKSEQKNKLDQFFVKKQKIQSTVSSQVMPMQQQQQYNNMMNSSQSNTMQNQVQLTLFRFSTNPNQRQNREMSINNNNTSTYNSNFNVQQQPLIQDQERLFQDCKECNRTVCFNCWKQCSKCENMFCPLPLCTTKIYGQYEDDILCSQCVSG